MNRWGRSSALIIHRQTSCHLLVQYKTHKTHCFYKCKQLKFLYHGNFVCIWYYKRLRKFIQDFILHSMWMRGFYQYFGAMSLNACLVQFWMWSSNLTIYSNIPSSVLVIYAHYFKISDVGRSICDVALVYWSSKKEEVLWFTHNSKLSNYKS